MKNSRGELIARITECAKGGSEMQFMSQINFFVMGEHNLHPKHYAST